MSAPTTNRPVRAGAHTTRSLAIPARLAALVAIAVSLACAIAGAAPTLAAAGDGCPNEQPRAESNVNPATGQPYSQGLPECRAYEMVSPLDKQTHDALPINREGGRLAVAENGDAVSWYSEGAFAEAPNYTVRGIKPKNPYVSYRTADGWVTHSAYPPAEIMADPAGSELGGILFSTDFSAEAECGNVAIDANSAPGPTIRCALRQKEAGWLGTPEWTDVTGQGAGFSVIGADSTATSVVFHGEPGVSLLASDTSDAGGTCDIADCGSIYEVTGLGGENAQLHLVDVDNSGAMIGPENQAAVGALAVGAVEGDDYHAIAGNGEIVYFTATPEGGAPTIYARVAAEETITISAPSPSCGCAGPAQEAVYQGASANGEKVFFTTAQPLVDGDTDTSGDLYEYDFAEPPGRRLIQVSRGGLGDLTPGTGAEVAGVVAISKDGSHVYYAAGGALTSVPNALGDGAVPDPPAGAENIYGYDTETGETRFVATLPEADAQLWGSSKISASGSKDIRLAQVDAGGQFLVFDTFAKLVTTGPEADTNEAQDVYRYDFDTGDLLRVSLGTGGATSGISDAGAAIGPSDLGKEGASPTAENAERSVDEAGDLIAFVMPGPLANESQGARASCAEGGTVQIGGPGCQVYVWHECPGARCADGDGGEVNMISDGQDQTGVLYGGMSPSGADVFFQTRTQLVGQDTDELGDIYDASIDGGFPAPTPPPECSGEACQGAAAPVPSFAAPSTASFTGGGNLTSGSTSFPPAAGAKPKPKPLTKARELAKALKRCDKDTSKKRKKKSCEKTAKKRYGKTAKTKE